MVEVSWEECNEENVEDHEDVDMGEPRESEDYYRIRWMQRIGKTFVFWNYVMWARKIGIRNGDNSFDRIFSMWVETGKHL